MVLVSSVFPRDVIVSDVRRSGVLMVMDGFGGDDRCGVVLEGKPEATQIYYLLHKDSYRGKMHMNLHKYVSPPPFSSHSSHSNFSPQPFPLTAQHLPHPSLRPRPLHPHPSPLPLPLLPHFPHPLSPRNQTHPPRPQHLIRRSPPTLRPRWMVEG